MGLRRFIKNYRYKNKFKVSEIIEKKIKNQNFLITGANSGIGLALTTRLLSLNNKIFATFNQNNENLLKLRNNNLKIIQCDQSEIENIEKLKKFLRNEKINIIINNAATWGGNEQGYNNTNYENFHRAINVNALSILKLSEVVLKYASKDCLNSIVNISSLYTSIERNKTGKDYIYKGSKSLMNSISKNLSIDLKKDYGINVFSICPGNVKTKLNPLGILDPKIVALNIINILESSNGNYNGKFIDLNKDDLAW